MSILAHIGFTIILFLAILKYLGKDLRSYDLRLVIVGALLPDIIDKPLSLLSLGSGRGYAHTLLFMVLVLVLAYRHKAMELAFGNAVHLSLDFMFLEPRIFLWPLLGTYIEVTTHTSSYYWDQIFTSLFVQVTEGLGLACIILFVHMFGLRSPGRLRRFLSNGELVPRQANN
ncbi:MAG TPA: metal-dependent hydrolase [Candidatus Methanofastidiosa archaeon]|mgnify:CR=1 FL=1|nr:metal-dependent hydrolase [Candidatus Methanofastidiosa archaeon]